MCVCVCVKGGDGGPGKIPSRRRIIGGGGHIYIYKIYMCVRTVVSLNVCNLANNDDDDEVLSHTAPSGSLIYHNLSPPGNNTPCRFALAADGRSYYCLYDTRAVVAVKEGPNGITHSDISMCGNPIVIRLIEHGHPCFLMLDPPTDLPTSLGSSVKKSESTSSCAIVPNSTRACGRGD